MPTDWTDMPTLARYITVPNTTTTTGYTIPTGYTTTTATIDASTITTGNQYFVSTPYVTGTTTATGTGWQNYATTNPYNIAHHDYVPVRHITYSRDYVDDPLHDLLNVRTVHVEEKDIGVENMEMDDDTSEIDNFLAEFTIREED